MHYVISCRSCGYVYRIVTADGRTVDESDAFDNARVCEAAASFVLRAKAWSEANPDRQPPIGDADAFGGGVPVLPEKARHRAWLGNREVV